MIDVDVQTSSLKQTKGTWWHAPALLSRMLREQDSLSLRVQDPPGQYRETLQKASKDGRALVSGPYVTLDGRSKFWGAVENWEGS